MVKQSVCIYIAIMYRLVYWAITGLNQVSRLEGKKAGFISFSYWSLYDILFHYIIDLKSCQKCRFCHLPTSGSDLNVHLIWIDCSYHRIDMVSWVISYACFYWRHKRPCEQPTALIMHSSMMKIAEKTWLQSILKQLGICLYFYFFLIFIELYIILCSSPCFNPPPRSPCFQFTQ